MGGETSRDEIWLQGIERTDKPFGLRQIELRDPRRNDLAEPGQQR